MGSVFARRVVRYGILSHQRSFLFRHIDSDVGNDCCRLSAARPFAIATALPVLIVAWILAFSVQHIGALTPHLGHQHPPSVPLSLLSPFSLLSLPTPVPFNISIPTAQHPRKLSALNSPSNPNPKPHNQHPKQQHPTNTISTTPTIPPNTLFIFAYIYILLFWGYR